MKLVDRRLVDLDAHPASYVPEAEGFHGDLKVRHLLNHSSGIPDFVLTEEFFRKYGRAQDISVRALLQKLVGYPAWFAPEENAIYENSNFVICALIIENITGKAYSDYMREEVFLPLGMRDAIVDSPDTVIKNRVVGYDMDDKGSLYRAVEDTFCMLGAGDIVATVNDVYCLNTAIKQKRLISEAAWQRVLTPFHVNKMGFGCTLSLWHGKQRITHNGGSTGFRTLHVQLPEDDFDIILLSNFGFGDARNVISEYIYTCFYSDDQLPSQTLEMDKGYAK